MCGHAGAGLDASISGVCLFYTHKHMIFLT